MTAVLGRPAAWALLGALGISMSAVLVRLADQPPATTAFFRCLYALPVLAAIAWFEDRRHGRLEKRTVLLAALAGVFFAIDLETWNHGIEGLGAGLATVVSNLQVVVVALFAWVVLGERPSNRLLAAIPIAVLGVVFISGVIGKAAYGERPLFGVVMSLLTALSYGAFLLVLRSANRGQRRPGGPLLVATAACAVTLLVTGVALDELEFVPVWPAHGWTLLQALSAQVLGYFAVSRSLPRLPAAMTSLLLLAQPMLAMLFAAAIVDERPSAFQLFGVLLVLAGILVGVTRLRRSA